jgi:hypothetical protein
MYLDFTARMVLLGFLVFHPVLEARFLLSINLTAGSQGHEAIREYSSSHGRPLRVGPSTDEVGVLSKGRKHSASGL